MQIHEAGMNPNDILKIRYTARQFDFSTMSCHNRKVYELFPDGRIIYSVYETGSRKAKEKLEKHLATSEDFSQLCEKINYCISHADRFEFIVDDSSAEVKIYRPYSRVETMDRGLGTATTNLENIISEYIEARDAIE